jgi:hypothetical protein
LLTPYRARDDPSDQTVTYRFIVTLRHTTRDPSASARVTCIDLRCFNWR